MNHQSSYLKFLTIRRKTNLENTGMQLKLLNSIRGCSITLMVKKRIEMKLVLNGVYRLRKLITEISILGLTTLKIDFYSEKYLKLKSLLDQLKRIIMINVLWGNLHHQIERKIILYVVKQFHMNKISHGIPLKIVRKFLIHLSMVLHKKQELNMYKNVKTGKEKNTTIL